MIDNPYEAPRAEGAPSPSIDLRRAARAFAGWLLGASLVAGALRALQAGHALSAFSAEPHIGGLLAVSAFRAGAAHLAAAAASVALVVATHPSPPPSAAGRRAIRPWVLYAAVPLATPIAACAMIAAGVGTAALTYDVAPRASWQGVLELIHLGDSLCGIASACLYALVLAAIVAVVGPRFTSARRGLGARIVIALLATGLVTGIVGGAVNAAFPEGLGSS